MTTSRPIDLSVVIVNYNVVNFLEQCLNSVFAASQNLHVEVLVVDNNSVDESVGLVSQKFPNVKLIVNTENLGFSKANNQAILQCKGRYILLLNPDTVVEQDTFDKCIEYMDEHPNTGGLGVRMIDGKGKFLPESKRGLPTPAVSFYKIFGLAALFPKNKRFGRYHLGFLDEFKTHQVDVLSGAFMLLRAETLLKVGLLDEAFFMYGEDIDLSYRITKEGYQNVYFPDAKIIHYKGESTKKGSLNYVFVFYNAMVIFAKKHYSERYAKIFSLAINIAIYLRASISIFKRIAQNLSWPLFDFFSTYSILVILGHQWEKNQIQFPELAYNYLSPVYIFTWVFCTWLFGLYDKGTSIHRIWKSTFIATITILVAYALFPKEWQFSRLFILIGALSYLTIFYASRALIDFIFKGRINFGKLPKKRFGILANDSEFDRIKSLIEQTYPNIGHIAQISPENDGQIVTQISEFIRVHQLNELIFSVQDFGAANIIQLMAETSGLNLEYKIAQPNTSYLIGSSSIDQAGAYYNLHFDALQLPSNKRLKRLFDMVLSFTLLLVSPFIIWKFRQPKHFITNLFQIFFGRLSFVGVGSKSNASQKTKRFLLHPKFNKDEAFDIQAFMYMKSYRIQMDLFSVWNQLLDLDKAAE